MPEDYLSELPSHLHPLLEPTPGGNAKLLAAWDGLNVETQIQLLSWIEQHENKAYSVSAIREKAIDSTNAYVRYLAAKHLRWNQEVKPRIESDEDPLVRYTALSFGVTKPEELFKLPQDARLACVRDQNNSGQLIASFVEYAIDHQGDGSAASKSELKELLSEYVGGAFFRETYFTDPYKPSIDGWSDYEKGKDIDALWTLVPKLSIELADILVNSLPMSSGLSSERSKEFLLSLNPCLLNRILRKRENKLRDFRRAVFWDGTGVVKEYTVSDAVQWNFDLTLEEFGKILALPNEERFAKLDALTNANELRLVFYEAIRDHVRAHEDAAPSSLSDSVVYFLMDTARYRLSNLQGEQKEEELRLLGLYVLARRIAPPGTDEDSPLDLSNPNEWRARAHRDPLTEAGKIWQERKKEDPFARLICKLWNFQQRKDTWTTFMELEKNWWLQNETLQRQFRKALPNSSRIYEEGDLWQKEDVSEERIERQLEELAWRADTMNWLCNETVYRLDRSIGSLQWDLGKSKKEWRILFAVTIGAVILLVSVELFGMPSFVRDLGLNEYPRGWSTESTYATRIAEMTDEDLDAKLQRLRKGMTDEEIDAWIQELQLELRRREPRGRTPLPSGVSVEIIV